MVKAKIWTLQQKFDGVPKLSDFQLVEEDLPETLEKGEILCETIHLSVDPYMRYLTNDNLGLCMFGENISKVIISENPDYPVGTVVRSYSGWRSHVYIKNPVPVKGKLGFPTICKMPELDGLPQSLALGVMGMPGMSAYFGFLEICNPKEGETVLVNGAAGAVGSLVGQIAKIKKCRVLGFAGSDAKCKWLMDDLGFDEAFNYKKVNLDEVIKNAAPDGIDCYFDNVGADFTAIVLQHMKVFGRVSICGQISSYNATTFPTGPYPFMAIKRKQLKVEGFAVTRWLPRWPEGEKAMAQWITEGKIKYRESVTHGFENMPVAFIGLFKGENTGKSIVNT